MPKLPVSKSSTKISKPKLTSNKKNAKISKPKLTINKKNTKGVKKLDKKEEVILKTEDDSNIDDMPLLEEEDNDIEYNADEEEFFDEKNFKEFNAKIKFHIFDPEKYENEIHKEIIIVPNNYRRTSEIMTKYEYTEVLSHRAKQIENGGKVFTNVGTESDPVNMAIMEIKNKHCPLAIRRIISNNLAEIWDVNDMVLAH